jgi:tetratricopeptide (TPR) repeat protein
MASSRFAVIVLICATLLVPEVTAQVARDRRSAQPNPAEALDRTLAAAEAALRDRELQLAESRYRALLFEAWMTLGELHVVAGRLEPARDAFRHASTSVVESAPAFQSLALVQLQLGQVREAVSLLTTLAARNRDDLETRRLLAQALVASGAAEEAVQMLEEAHAAAPADPELAFLLATGYLHVKKVAAAEQMFARVAAARPIPQTYVLIGRTYRDFRLYDRARAALETALKKEPRTPRAHYYLGTAAVMEEGLLGVDSAIREFREELTLVPDDPAANLKLGMALVETRRTTEALRPLEIATRGAPGSADAWHYLGRCLRALGRPADALAALRRSLELSQGSRTDPVRLRNLHYQLAVTLRATGATEEAAVHFAEAERASAERSDADRENLTKYLSDTANDSDAGEAAVSVPLESGFSAFSPAQRADLEGRATTALARAYVNLGVMHAQAQRFARAAELFEQAAAVAPSFPQVQYSLGVAYFNAQQHGKAVAPLERALATDPGNADMQRMLALASLNSEQYEKAASLLAADPRRDSDPSLLYAYGVALIRSDRAAEAEAVFERLLAAHGATPELRVVLGQAHAQQGDYDSAIAELQGALTQKPDVAEANATLGVIYLKQGKLPEARAVLRAELQAHPGDEQAAHTLATVLDLEGEQQEAIAVLRSVIGARPDFADARYLLGKILLARGAADEAAEQLEAAARLAPEDANIHYQLAQTYRKQGRIDLADRQFEIYQRLKEKRRVR